MIWIFVVLAAIGVFVIAAVAVGRETFRLGHQLPATILDVEEAVAVVAEDLPDEVQARLSYDDVRTLILAQLDHLRERGILGLPGEEPRGLPNGKGGDGDERSVGQDRAGPSSEIVVGDEEAVAAVLERLDVEDLEVSDADAYTVLSALRRHLAAIGAIGPEA